MNIVLLKHDDSLKGLNQWKHDTELVEKTVKRVKSEELAEKRGIASDGIASLQLRAWHLVVGILMVVSAIVYAIASTRGVKP